MAAFFSFDKDFQPVFIDYCLMTHADSTVQQFISPLLPFVAQNVCVRVFVSSLLVHAEDHNTRSTSKVGPFF